ncbi:MAG: hypothetical protein J7604_09855 [Sporocytophaga sp.]|uniref:hypothetical protein n=1 Tax=Sporocytophaga sp. TaxID=2231183 RepID=UPI001B128CCC|nr:hypothetical protein [Sporocytophaga sp.]MBO9700500.1 hypothetical protein [Sporocytophaga sp.]
MNNFVIIYRFRSPESGNVFLESIEKTFPRHLNYNFGGIQYFLLSSKLIAEVQDKINDIFDNLDIRDDDYVAIYYSREEDPDDIKRLMMLGHADLIDEDLKNGGTILDRTLSELLEYDFNKQKAEL